MSKPEVCAFLGKSKRTIDSYIATGRLKVGYFNGPNGKTGIFQRADVEALKVELDTPTYRAPVSLVPSHLREMVEKRAAITKALAPAPDFAALAVAMRSALRVEEPKPWLPLAEAAEYSGLPASYLLAQARAGKLRAINVGNGSKEFWRFHRGSLAK